MTYFQNISRIMDCVECEKCKTYGKMQVYGIGKFPIYTRNCIKNNFFLQRKSYFTIN